MIVREHINFKRGLEPKDAMRVGLGAWKYVDTFEKELDNIPKIRWSKKDHKERGFINWSIYNRQSGSLIADAYILRPSNEDAMVDWVCKDADETQANHSDPFFIIEYLKNLNL